MFDIIKTNSRWPDFVSGDLWAQVAASKSAERQIIALFQKYGRATVERSISAAFETGRARALSGLATLPQGTFSIEELQDDGSLWRASITSSEKSFSVDLTNNPPADAGPYNTSRDGIVIACQMMFKGLCDPERFAITAPLHRWR